MEHASANCINLRNEYGHRFRIANEESYAAERGDCGRATDPWVLILMCKHGHIYPYGGRLLAASTNNTGKIAGKLASMPCVTVVQDGDDGINAIFLPDDFDTVAGIMKPRRRRRMTDDQRRKAADRLAKHLFRPQSRPKNEAQNRSADLKAAREPPTASNGDSDNRNERGRGKRNPVSKQEGTRNDHDKHNE